MVRKKEGGGASEPATELTLEISLSLSHANARHRVYYTLPETSDGVVNGRVWERHLLPHPKYSPASVFHPRGKMFCATHYDVPHLYIFLPRELDLVLIRRSLRMKSGWRGEWEEVLRLPGARMMEVLVDVSVG
jgi:hypothetical protein